MRSYSIKVTPSSRDLLEKLTVPQLVEKVPAFHKTRRLVTMPITAFHLSPLRQTNPVHALPSYLISLLILNFHLPLRHLSSILPSGTHLHILLL